MTGRAGTTENVLPGRTRGTGPGHQCDTGEEVPESVGTSNTLQTIFRCIDGEAKRG